MQEEKKDPRQSLEATVQLIRAIRLNPISEGGGIEEDMWRLDLEDFSATTDKQYYYSFS